jgi:uncharacterized MAPEG superfamily protein|tara:strand:- start:778 stop:1170 length:393 start_codon:yes stop_codon:yes gene_type:complete
MTTPFWCLLIVVALPLLLAFVGDYFRFKQFEKFDNNHPRAQVLGLEGAGARSYAAQDNAWEAVAMFVPAVLVAHLTGVAAETAALAAMIFVGARVAHAILYIANIAALRSLSFVVGLGCCLWLFYLSAQA